MTDPTNKKENPSLSLLQRTAACFLRLHTLQKYGFRKRNTEHIPQTKVVKSLLSSVNDILPLTKKKPNVDDLKQVSEISEKWAKLNSQESTKFRWWGHVLETFFVASAIAMEKCPKLRAKDTKGLAPLLIAFVVIEFMVRAPSRIVPAPGLQDLAKRHEELANRWNDFGKEARELVICRVNIRQMDTVHFYRCGLALSDDTDVACLGWKHCPTDKRKLEEYILHCLHDILGG